jgi:thiol:disulfide interchange protein
LTASAGTATSAIAGTTGAAPPAAAAAPVAVAVRVPDLAVSSQASTLGAYVGLAAIMGALSLLTPCVFPMVPITISYFTNRAGKSRREATVQALIYGLGIVLTFTAVGFTLAVAFGASGLNRFAADPWLNLGITALFLAFAMSLFGVWELALPSGLVNAASKADSGKGRVAGTLLMGLAFTLTSFTCTAPFLGTLLVVASQGDWQWPLAGMLAFSSVFALPFVILALVPQTLAALPRSGPWLIAVKAVMGLVEIAAAMKFLSNADLVWNWGIFTRPVVLATWVVLSVVLVAYLAGWTKLGPVPKMRRPGFGRWSAVAAGVLVGAWLAGGLMGRRLGELEAFLPPADLTHMAGSEMTWVVNDYDAGLAQAKKNNQPMLVDFTGYTCTNCRWMEANMFTKPEVERELARYVRVRLYTDRPGEPYVGYQKMERDLFGTVALPYYAVFSPEGKPVVAFGGLTRDSGEYVNFLRRGIQ